MSTGDWSWGEGSYDGVHDDKPASAEERLWMAVVELCVHDFKIKLGHAARDISRYGRVSAHTLWELKSIRYEAKSEWFGEISDYAGIHGSIVVSYMDKQALGLGIDLKLPVLNPNEKKVKGPVL